MLRLAEGNKIRLFPAWPENWEVEFKLHVPYNTMMDGVYREGKIQSRVVSPPQRTGGIELPNGFVPLQ